MTSEFQAAFAARFPKFGVNKSREIHRLSHEIALRENTSPEKVLESIKEKDYQIVKSSLLRRRYPLTFTTASLNSFYLPKYEINPDFKADTREKSFSPENIYCEKSATGSLLTDNVKKLFPKAAFMEIASLKSFLADKSCSVKDYNNRCGTLFLTNEKYDFFKKCPCTGGVVNCGYSIMNLGMGCPYECSYCFLQGYQNVPGVLLPCNISDYLSDEKIVSNVKGLFNYKRIGSGEFTDSLVFDHITNFSKKIIPFFKNRKDIFFEFKTKSVNINNLLECGGANNIIAAWSVNSEKISAENEHKAPSVKQRLEAAKLCAEAGFSTAFHFDPIIPEGNWESGYKETVDMIFDIVPAESIKWISLGTLRMPAALKTVIENRFPENNILNGELLLGKDYKLRYDDALKTRVYKFMNELIKSKKSKAAVYLCMEEADIWKKSGML
jgi:DNA repair photolyase